MYLVKYIVTEKTELKLNGSNFIIYKKIINICAIFMISL